MLQISRLSKRFGSLQALNELSFHVGDDELVGFVGANGAGKSTTMRIAMGVLEADSGTVTWDGQPVDAGLRRRIGYMPEERGLYPKMKVEAQLTYLARLHGVSKARAQEAALEWTERLGIQARRGDEVQKLSLGNQQRVQLAAALVADPALLILDEPVSGLDPVAVDVMSQVLRERAEAGIPTLFSSHQLDVVERLCDRIVIIRSGQLVAAGTIEELAATASPRWRVVIDDGAAAAGAPAATSQTEPSPLSPALAGLPQVEVSRDSHGRLIVTASGQDEQELLAAARSLGTVRELGPVRKPLTEIFREALTAPAVDGENPPRTEETTR